MNEQVKSLELMEASLDIQEGNRAIEHGVAMLRHALEDTGREVGHKIDSTRERIHEKIEATRETAWRWGGIGALASFTFLVSFALTRAFTEPRPARRLMSGLVDADLLEAG